MRVFYINMSKKISGEKTAPKRKILIIEDDQFLTRVYQAKLSREGFEVLTAFNGDEGINLAKAKKPEIILLDLVMPIKDGFMVLKELKKESCFKKVPVIILSNLGQDSDLERAKNLGAVDYLVKTNVSINEVVAKIREYLK